MSSGGDDRGQDEERDEERVVMGIVPFLRKKAAQRAIGHKYYIVERTAIVHFIVAVGHPMTRSDHDEEERRVQRESTMLLVNTLRELRGGIDREGDKARSL
eukprot:gene28110-47651_t